MRSSFPRLAVAVATLALVAGSAAPARKVDNANVVKADVVATNGVIHAIDAVILPR